MVGRGAVFLADLLRLCQVFFACASRLRLCRVFFACAGSSLPVPGHPVLFNCATVSLPHTLHLRGSLVIWSAFIPYTHPTSDTKICNPPQPRAVNRLRLAGHGSLGWA